MFFCTYTTNYRYLLKICQQKQQQWLWLQKYFNCLTVCANLLVPFTVMCLFRKKMGFYCESDAENLLNNEARHFRAPPAMQIICKQHVGGIFLWWFIIEWFFLLFCVKYVTFLNSFLNLFTFRLGWRISRWDHDDILTFRCYKLQSLIGIIKTSQV